VYAGALAGGAAARAAPRVLGASSVARLEALARARAPLRRVLARIAGRIVARRSWERLGFARIGDYARERAGLSGRQLLDLAHVDARLAELSAVEAAFVAGRLSWSKARLLAGVARAAQRVPVRGLEREVRGVDLGSVEAGALESDEDGAPRYPMTGVRVRCAPDVQGKFHRARWLAQRVAGERLPTWACMEAVAAEVVSALGASVSEQDDPDSDSDAARACGASWSDRAARPTATEVDVRDAPEVRDAMAADAQPGASGADRALADVCAPEPSARVHLPATSPRRAPRRPATRRWATPDATMPCSASSSMASRPPTPSTSTRGCATWSRWRPASTQRWRRCCGASPTGAFIASRGAPTQGRTRASASGCRSARRAHWCGSRAWVRRVPSWRRRSLAAHSPGSRRRCCSRSSSCPNPPRTAPPGSRAPARDRAPLLRYAPGERLLDGCA